MSTKSVKIEDFRQVASLFVAALILGVTLAVLVGDYYERQAHQMLELRSKQVLALHKEAIFGLLDKFRLMTVLVAHRPDTVAKFASLLQTGTDEISQASQLNLQNFAGRLAAMSGAKHLSIGT